MPDRELLLLDLKAPLPYRGIENPPLSGLPAPEQGGALLLGLGASAEPSGKEPSGKEPAREGTELPEGGEELFAYEEAALFAFDPEEGPRVAAALPPPLFYGRSAPAGGGEDTRSLPPGRYLFFQLRPRGEAELLEALEWFGREAWWERQAGQGPYFLRRVREDGKLATQILRRIEN